MLVIITGECLLRTSELARGNPAPDLTPSWVRDSQSEAEAGALDQSEARQEGMEVGGG